MINTKIVSRFPSTAYCDKLNQMVRPVREQSARNEMMHFCVIKQRAVSKDEMVLMTTEGLGKLTQVYIGEIYFVIEKQPWGEIAKGDFESDSVWRARRLL